MSLQQIKNLKSEKGFTIVELLIVIVVIGILAAIIIVAFNGVQNQARTTQAQSAASNVAKKAEAYNADPNGGNGSYPTAFSQLSGAASTASYSVQGVSLATALFTSGTAPSSPNTVAIATCTGGGGRVYYYDYGTGAAATAAKAPEYGGATDSSSCTTFLAS